jgi:type I restriction enzyme S subunit
MLEKKLVPKLRFAEFDGVWEVKKLQDRCVFFAGGTPTSTKKEYYNGNIPFIGSGNIFDEKVYKFITEEAFSNSSAKIVNQGDILYALYGANSGEVSISKISGAINQAILCIRTEEEKGFLFQILSHKKNRIVSTYLQGGQGNLSSQIIKKLKLNFPSLPEQQKIASFLTEVDTKLSQLTKKKALLENYKKGVMQKIFSQQLRFKDGNGNDYGDWEEKKLGEVAIINMGQSPESSSYNSIGNGYYLIQGNADISNRKTSPRNWTNEPTKLCDIGDLILTVRAPVGAIAKSNHNACIGRGVCSIKNKKKSNIAFLYQFLLDFENRWNRLEQGSTFTAVSGKDIRSVEVPFPCFEEQTKIADFLSDLDTKIEVLSTSIENTQTFKKGLLQQLFV